MSIGSLFSQPSGTHGPNFDQENNFKQPWKVAPFWCVWRMFNFIRKNSLERITETLKHILKASCEGTGMWSIIVSPRSAFLFFEAKTKTLENTRKHCKSSVSFLFRPEPPDFFSGSRHQFFEGQLIEHLNQPWEVGWTTSRHLHLHACRKHHFAATGVKRFFGPWMVGSASGWWKTLCLLVKLNIYIYEGVEHHFHGSLYWFLETLEIFK